MKEMTFGRLSSRWHW